jgi:hypothetical protein
MSNYDEYEVSNESFAQNDPTSKRGGGTSYMTFPEDVPVYKPVEGKKQHIRIITQPGLGSFSRLVLAHFDVGGFNSVTCPRTFGEAECPVCEKRNELYNVNKEAAKKFKTTKYNAIYVIDRNNEALGPQLWMVSGVETMKTILNLIRHPETDAIHIQIGHPTKGRDLFFKKYKVGDSIYATINEIKLDLESTPLADDTKQIDEWLEFIKDHPVDSMINQFTYDEIKELMNKKPVETKATEAEAEEDPIPQSTVKSSAPVVEKVAAVKNVLKPSETTGQDVTAPVTTTMADQPPKPAVDREQLKAKIAAMRSSK